MAFITKSLHERSCRPGVLLQAIEYMPANKITTKWWMERFELQLNPEINPKARKRFFIHPLFNRVISIKDKRLLSDLKPTRMLSISFLLSNPNLTTKFLFEIGADYEERNYYFEVKKEMEQLKNRLTSRLMHNLHSYHLDNDQRFPFILSNQDEYDLVKATANVKT